MNKLNEDKDFHNFVQLSDTRWLARHNVVKVILEHYFELKIHFKAVVKKNEDKYYKARELDRILQDDSTYLYLAIVSPILYELNSVNQLFQSDKCDVGNAYLEITNFLLLLGRKIMKETAVENIETLIKSVKNDNSYLPADQCDLTYSSVWLLIK
ncbi:hypothetical protein TKK_0011097 [Trichogramma kaykai]